MKPPYSITKLAGSDMREQIAGVVIHWSMLELTVERVVANLEGNDSNVTFEEDLSDRLKLLKKLARQKLSKSDADEIVEIAGQIKTLSHDRNRVVHGLWGLDANVNVFSIYYREKRGTLAKPMNAEDVRQIKLQIWRKIKPLRKFAPLALAAVHA